MTADPILAFRNRFRVTLMVTALCPGLFAASNWTAIGPEGGTVTRLTVDFRNPSTIYAGTCAGVFKSVDRGTNWTATAGLAIPGQPETGCVGALEIDPQDSEKVYAAGAAGLTRSRDAGKSWSAMDLGFGARSCSQITTPAKCSLSLAIDPGNPATLYVGGNGIFKSTDSGISWVRLSAALSPFNATVNAIAVDPHNGETLYAADDGGLFQSTDGGRNWFLVHSGTGPTAGVAVDPQNSNVVYYGIVNRLFKSADGGASWNDITPTLPPAPAGGFNVFQCVVLHPQKPGFIRAVMFQNSNGQVFPDRSLLFTSEDGGQTWSTSAASILTVNDLLSIVPDPVEADIWYAGTNNGVLKTTDRGIQWSFTNAGLRAVHVTQVLIDQRTGMLLATTDFSLYFFIHFNKMFKSTDGGKSWTAVDDGLPATHGPLMSRRGDLSVLYTTGAYVPYRPNGAGLFMSSDAGATWRQIWVKPATLAGTQIDSIGPLALDPGDQNHMYMGAAGSCSVNCVNWLLETNDAGRTWSLSQPSQADGSPFATITIDPLHPAIIYGATDSFGGWTDTGVWKSLDQGSHWSKLTVTASIANTILIDSSNPQTVYFADGVVHKSTDGGQTWSDVLRGGYSLLATNDQTPDTLYAASGWLLDLQSTFPHRLMKSTDAGASWSPLHQALDYLYSLVIDPRDSNTLYAGSGGGLFSLTLEPESRRPPQRR